MTRPMTSRAKNIRPIMRPVFCFEVSAEAGIGLDVVVAVVVAVAVTVGVEVGLGVGLGVAFR